MSFRIIDGKLYLTNVARKRYSFPELCRLVQSWCEKFHPDHLVIENASNGQSLIQYLNEKFKGTDFCERYPFFVQKINPTESKITRMERALVPIEEGKVLLPERADWLSALESELRAFPNGRFNDQVDALSQAVKFFTWYMQQPFAEERKRGFQHLR